MSKSRSFFCCANFCKKAQDPVGLPDQSGPQDYIVEKLAVKKVPVHLFASPDEMEEYKARSAKSKKMASPPSIEPHMPPAEQPPQFATYYKVAPRTDMNQISHSTLNDKEGSIELAYTSDEDRSKYVKPTVLPRRKVLTEDEEKELVTHILSKHSSLFTLDPKNPVPKDPTQPPRSNAVVPPRVHHALNTRQAAFPPLNKLQARDYSKQSDFPGLNRNQIRVDIHNATIPEVSPMKSPAEIPRPKKQLTPELKETIEALGVAQRPGHLPGIPPKNQRSVKGHNVLTTGPNVMTTSPNAMTTGPNSFERELSTNILGGEEIFENMPSKELRCQMLKSSIRYAETIDDSSISDYKSNSDFKSTAHYKDYTSPGYNNVNYKSPSPISDHLPNFLKGSPAPQATYTMAGPPAIPIAVGPSTPCVKDSDQVTEISQLKGQNLKWKIIIKHHAEEDIDKNHCIGFEEHKDVEMKALCPNR